MDKPCLCCKKEKPLSGFGKSRGIKKFYPRSYCKKCAIKKLNYWRDKNPEKVQRSVKEHYRKHINEYKNRAQQCYLRNPEKWNLRRYRMTPEEYEKLLKIQNGVCAICLNVESIKRKKRLSVDHNHQTGKIRGLLCSKCNNGIGWFKEDLVILNRAVEYLRASDS